MPARFCLGKPGACRLGCVEFIYTSVSRNDTLSLVTTAAPNGSTSLDQINAAPILLRAEVIGELRFDGKRVTTAKAKDEQDEKLLKGLLERPAIRRSGLANDVFAKDDPAVFLRLLCETYRSHYFWASEAEAA